LATFFFFVTVILVQRLGYGLDETRSTSYVVWATSGKLGLLEGSMKIRYTE